METIAMPVHERGCGSVVGGELYMWMGLSENGIPLDNFAKDPILRIDMNQMGIKKRGMTIKELYGTYHIFDYIGEGSYPNVADWWEEIHRFGLHVRTEANLDFRKLDKTRSLYIPVHPRAYIENSEGVYRTMYYRRNLHQGHPNCRFEKADHDKWWIGELTLDDGVPPRCFETIYMNVKGGNPIAGDDAPEKQVVRHMPSFSYQAWSLFPNIASEPGAFAAFPISMLSAIIYDGEGFENTLEMANQHGINEIFDPYVGVLVEDEDGFTDYENMVDWENQYGDTDDR